LEGQAVRSKNIMLVEGSWMGLLCVFRTLKCWR